jgi:hypothetical protein
MPEVVCHFPVTVRLRGELNDDHVAALAAAVESAFAQRVAAARAEVARRRVPVAGPPERSGHERLDRARLVDGESRYLVPSFGADTPPLVPHPVPTDPRADVVEPSPSPFEGQTIAIFPTTTRGSGWEALRVSSHRHAVTTDLSRAVGWGNLLFGAGSFAILEGPFGRPDSHYTVVGVAPAVSDAEIARAGPPDPAGRFTFTARYWQQVHEDAERRAYQLRTLVTREGTPLFSGNPFWLEEFRRELKATKSDAVIPAAYAAPMVFGEIDALLASEDIEGAAQRLSELDAAAFRIVDWETRARYVKTLVDAWTWEAQEVAIVELLKASSGPSELRATIDVLRKAGIYDQLFHDLNSQLFSLLVTIGEAHGERGPITLGFLVRVMQDAGLLPASAAELARRVVLGPTADIVDIDLLAELEEAAYSFVNFLSGSLEPILIVVSHPDKLVEGVAQLAKLSYRVMLAAYGHAPSILFLAKLLDRVGTQVIHGLRGADLLGVTEEVARRIKWALIWEIASMFVGVGEIAAAAKGIAAGEHAAALARLLAALRRLGTISRAEHAAERLPRLATVLKSATNVLEYDDEVLGLIAHLPDDDVARLGAVLEHVDELGQLTVGALGRRSSEAAEAAQDLVRRAELLKALAAKAGGLNDEVARVFRRLVGGSDGLGVDGAVDVVRAIPDGEMSRFTRALDALPPEELGKAAAERLRGIAASPKRMDAVVNVGHDTYRALEGRVGGRLQLLDEHLDTLAELEQKFAASDRYADYRRYLDQLTDGNPRAWDHLHDARTRPAGTREPPVSVGAEGEWTRYDAMRRRPLSELESDPDPLARQVLDDYRGRSADELERMAPDDPLAAEVLEGKLGGKRRPFAPHRPSSPEMQAQLRADLQRARADVEAARPEPLLGPEPDWARKQRVAGANEPQWVPPTHKQAARYRGTVGVARSDVPALEGRLFRGASPEAGGKTDPTGRIAPSKQLAAVPQAHRHAEQDLANQLDKALTSLTPDEYKAASGRSVFLRIDQAVCSTCAAGLSGGTRDGVLKQLSRLHPNILFEVTADDGSDVIRLLGGVRL